MNDQLSREIESALDEEGDIYEPGRGPISINREGSGHTYTINDSMGTMVVGVIAVILLWALLLSESRNRKLQAKVATAKE